MNIAFFALTQSGTALARRLSLSLNASFFPKKEGLPLAQAVSQVWDAYDGFVFIMAAGIVVRTIAPLLKSKTKDPAVVVMDQEGAFAVSLLSGHLGGANWLAQRVARLSGGQAVITTATDVSGTLAFDLFADRNHMLIENIHMLKYISAAMVERASVDVICPYPFKGDFPPNVRVVTSAKEGAAPDLGSAKVCVRIGHDCRTDRRLFDRWQHVLYLRPQNLWLGMGCKKNTDPAIFFQAFETFMEMHHLNRNALCGLATIGLKENEACIQELSRQTGLKVTVVANEKIQALESSGLFETSEFVRQVTGVASVCEACALIAPGAGRSRLLVNKTIFPGITFALGEEIKEWIV